MVAASVARCARLHVLAARRGDGTRLAPSRPGSMPDRSVPLRRARHHRKLGSGRSAAVFRNDGRLSADQQSLRPSERPAGEAAWARWLRDLSVAWLPVPAEDGCAPARSPMNCATFPSARRRRPCLARPASEPAGTGCAARRGGRGVSGHDDFFIGWADRVAAGKGGSWGRIARFLAVMLLLALGAGAHDGRSRRWWQ